QARQSLRFVFLLANAVYISAELIARESHLAGLEVFISHRQLGTRFVLILEVLGEFEKFVLAQKSIAIGIQFLENRIRVELALFRGLLRSSDSEQETNCHDDEEQSKPSCHAV